MERASKQCKVLERPTLASRCPRCLYTAFIGGRMIRVVAWTPVVRGMSGNRHSRRIRALFCAEGSFFGCVPGTGIVARTGEREHIAYLQRRRRRRIPVCWRSCWSFRRIPGTRTIRTPAIKSMSGIMLRSGSVSVHISTVCCGRSPHHSVIPHTSFSDPCQNLIAKFLGDHNQATKPHDLKIWHFDLSPKSTKPSTRVGELVFYLF